MLRKPFAVVKLKMARQEGFEPSAYGLEVLAAIINTKNEFRIRRIQIHGFAGLRKHYLQDLIYSIAFQQGSKYTQEYTQNMEMNFEYKKIF